MFTEKSLNILKTISYTIKATFTISHIAFAPARKPYRMGFLFTRKNGELGAIFVTGS